MRVERRFERIEGECEPIAGRFERLEGGFEGAKGRFDGAGGGFDRDGRVFDAIEGGLDRVEGGFERVEGRFERVEGASVPVETLYARADVPAVVRPATFDDRDAVVHALVRAFDADALTNFLLRKDSGRARAFETVFDVAFRRWSLPVGGAWIAEGGGGAALWVPPGQWKPLRAWPEALALMNAVGATRVPAVLSAASRASKHPAEAHWYLFAIGVDPDHQGRGIGTALLAPVLTRCDAERQLAYLEASSEMNARLYARHGFVVTETVDVAPGGPTVRLMSRDARP